MLQSRLRNSEHTVAAVSGVKKQMYRISVSVTLLSRPYQGSQICKPYSELFACKASLPGPSPCKAQLTTISGHFKRALRIGQIASSNTVGKIEPSYPYHYQYFCTFLDDRSRYTYLGLLQNESDPQNTFHRMANKLNIIASVRGQEFQCSSNILQLHSDWALEYRALQSDTEGKIVEQ